MPSENYHFFPYTLTGVSTSTAAFIGYTRRRPNAAGPKLITAYRELEALFGNPPAPRFSVIPVSQTGDADINPGSGGGPLLQLQWDNPYYLYSSARLFFQNGGKRLYIISVGAARNQYSNSILSGGLPLLNQLSEPAILAVPDSMALPATQCYGLQQQLIAYCAARRSLFCLLDIPNGYRRQVNGQDVITAFRQGIGVPGGNALSYAAAYYPWIVSDEGPLNQLSIRNFKQQVDIINYVRQYDRPDSSTMDALQKLSNMQANDPNFGDLNRELMAALPTYTTFLEAAHLRYSQQPAAGAVAGLFARTDNQRGVWKAPAGIGLMGVRQLVLELSDAEQDQLNVDPNGVKSVNTIRTFTGRGILVWGSRTLAGNDNEWRYVPVRRYAIYQEQSLLQALQGFSNSPNNAGTWSSVRSTVENFMSIHWRQGAFAGTTAKDAFFVRVGLGETMTQADIDAGRIRVEIGFAPVRPAEFIIMPLEIKTVSTED